MEVNTHLRLPVTERSQISAARIEARALAHQLGFGEEDEYRTGLVATELATNLVKHTREGGEILLRAVSRPVAAVELVAMDRGPGIADIARAFTDGVSSADSPGTGLGAIRRLSDFFDLYSSPSGTVALARVAARRATAPDVGPTVGGVSVPAPGESICGDLWSATLTAGGVTLAVADGLGHGAGAHAAARAVLEGVDAGAEPHLALNRLHQAIRHTRGAAVAIARLQPRERTVTFAGVGNVSGLVANGAAQHQMVSVNGTLGHHAQAVRQFVYPWPDESVVVLFTDGLTSHWTLERYPGLTRRHPTLIAAVLYRDHRRGRDDVTVVVATA